MRRRTRVITAGVAGVVALVAAIGVAAWFTAPRGTAIGARVAEHLRGTGGRAVPLAAVSRTLREAVVATEDERFYSHHGIDLLGVLRVLPYDLVHLSFAQGGSTITEQVAKVLYLHGNDHSPWRKLEDAALALKLERRYDKEQILGAYLNTAYFGAGAYGVEAAARRYFGVRPGSLDLSQSSLLAGLIQAPSAYDPLRHPGAARDRQVEVLRSLVRTGVLTSGEAAAIAARPLRLRLGSSLPGIRGVVFAVGPAFVWWELGVGLGALFIAAAVFVAARRLWPGPRRVLLLRATSAAVVLLAVTVVIRSFRVA